MANFFSGAKPISIVGLGTWTHNVTTPGMRYISAVASEVPPSGLSIVINLNGSPIATSVTPSAAQQVVSAQILTQCALNDVLTVVLSSSSPIDNQLNTVKTLINTRAGQ